MNKKNHPPADGSGQAQDVQQIRGIGASVARALNSIGVYTVQDLAACTPESLIERLRGRLPPLTLLRIEREDWIGQARQMAASQPPPEPSAAASYPAWQEVADFFVSIGYAAAPSGRRLQTKAHHSQADQMQVWDGLAMDDLVAWMLERARRPDEPGRPGETGRPGEPTQIEEPGSIGAVEPPGEPDLPAAAGGRNEAEPALEAAAPEISAWGVPGVELELRDLWVSEVSGEARAGRPARLQAEGMFSLAGEQAASLAEARRSYAIDIYLVNSQTNQPRLAVHALAQLEPGQLHYPFEQVFAIPPQGSYQIYVLAHLQIPGAPATHLQGPLLQVQA